MRNTIGVCVGLAMKNSGSYCIALHTGRTVLQDWNFIVDSDVLINASFLASWLILQELIYDRTPK